MNADEKKQLAIGLLGMNPLDPEVALNWYGTVREAFRTETMGLETHQYIEMVESIANGTQLAILPISRADAAQALFKDESTPGWETKVRFMFLEETSGRDTPLLSPVLWAIKSGQDVTGWDSKRYVMYYINPQGIQL